MNIADIAQIELEGSDGKMHKLGQFKGKNIILYFYPKDNTPGCTIQSREYAKMSKDFAAENAVIIGVSRGTAASKKSFCEKQGLNQLLLADPEGELINAFGAYRFALNGKPGKSVKRCSFIINPQQEVIRESLGPNPSEDALENYQFLLNDKENN